MEAKFVLPPLNKMPISLKQYSEDGSVYKCAKCNVFFSIEQCEIHTTKSQKMSYPICPICKVKHPMRNAPRNKRWFRDRVEYKRI